MFTLTKEKNKDFKILNLADIQLGNSEWDPECKNYKIATYTIGTLIKRISPDLITLSGDQGWAGQLDAYLHLGALIDSYNIPWTFVWGNHDQQDGYGFVDKIVEAYAHLKNLIYEHGPSELGRGNFVIKICEVESPISALILMDTHDRMPLTLPDGTVKNEWARLFPQQFEWYKEQVEELTKMGCRDTVILTHIPIYAYRTAMSEALAPEINKNKLEITESYMPKCWNDGYKDSFGIQREAISCYPEDDGFFEIINELGSTKHYLCGHDHINCTSINYRGVRLTYALKTGAGCYWMPELNGGTVIRITENGAATPEHEFVDIMHLI